MCNLASLSNHEDETVCFMFYVLCLLLELILKYEIYLKNDVELYVAPLFIFQRFSLMILKSGLLQYEVSLQGEVDPGAVESGRVGPRAAFLSLDWDHGDCGTCWIIRGRFSWFVDFN